ncbi:MAG: DUF5134 domain-containing protein [Acidimicrobiales bacterium]|jgi:hypothetical protein
MATTPLWLYYLFGVLVLVVVAYSVVLLMSSVATRRPLGWDVDISHLFMGLSMAGMFVTKWAFGTSTVWELIFSVLLIWFLVRTIQSMHRWGLHLSHFLIHAVMSFAMLLMYRFPLSAPMGAMSMSASAKGSRLDPGFSFVLAFILFASAVFTLASPNKGASRHGTHAPAYATGGTAGLRAATSHSGERITSVMSIENLLAAPRLEDASHVVMCVAMGFLLILML